MYSFESAAKAAANTYVAKPYTVQARKIAEVLGSIGGGGNNVRLEDGSTYPVTGNMAARHFPEAGDYLVISDDGYAYLNPAEVFEKKFEKATIRVKVGGDGTVTGFGFVPARVLEEHAPAVDADFAEVKKEGAGIVAAPQTVGEALLEEAQATTPEPTWAEKRADAIRILLEIGYQLRFTGDGNMFFDRDSTECVADQYPDSVELLKKAEQTIADLELKLVTAERQQSGQDDEIKEGDIVRLKSGGPAMVTQRECGVEITGRIGCTWFPEWDAKPLFHIFPVNALEKVKS